MRIEFGHGVFERLEHRSGLRHPMMIIAARKTVVAFQKVRAFLVSFAAFLSGCAFLMPAPDVTTKMGDIGIPFEADYPSPCMVGRNIWDMAVHQEECPDLVLERRDRLSAEARRVLFVLTQPEPSDGRAAHIRHSAPTVIVVGEQPEHIGQRRLWLIEEREQAISQNVFEPGPPRLGPELLERIEQRRRGERPFRWGHISHGIKPPCLRRIWRVEVNEIVETAGDPSARLFC